MPEAKRKQPDKVSQALRALTQFLFHCSPIGGPLIFTVRQCINLHKLLVAPVYLWILYAHGGGIDAFSFGQSYGPAAAMLFVCHTIYGFLWVYKDIFFPDRAWQVPMSPLGFLIIFLWPLATYYMGMYCLVTSSSGSPGDASALCPLPSFGSGSEPGLLGAGLACYVIGMFYHFCSDLQKHIQLKHQRPRSLITDGLFAHCRNPNYFGEIMIYTGYAIMSMNYTVLPVFSTAWIVIFLPNMLAKEASMSRYPQWAAWVERSGFVIPWLPSMLSDFASSALSKIPSVPEIECKGK